MRELSMTPFRLMSPLLAAALSAAREFGRVRFVIGSVIHGPTSPPPAYVSL